MLDIYQINPKLVEEQIRGGVIQGIGGALFEECVYDDQGNMQNATMACLLYTSDAADD